MKRTKFRTVVANLAVPMALIACGGDNPEEITAAPVRPVKLIEIGAASNERSNRYPAVIDATDLSELSFQVGGQITELPVNEAQEIGAGDLLARLDQRNFQNNLASAMATFENAEEEFQRATRLAEQDAIAQSVLEQRRSQRDVARAQLDSAEKALSDSELRAPFSGVVAAVPVRRLQTVSAGTLIATVIGRGSLDAIINLPASIVAQANTRQTPGAAILLEAVPGRQIVATFKEANLVADATSQTYAVTFSFAPPEDMLVLPGMNATVVLTSFGDGGRAAAAVPLAAVQSDGNGQYVWLVDGATMTVSRRAVAIEEGIGETVVVTAGLSIGDQIVGAGGAYLAEGLKVRPWTE